MFQILLFLPHVNSILTNLPLYEQLWHKFILFVYSTFSLISPSISPSNPNPLLSNPTLSLCLPLPVFLGLDASVLTKTLTFAIAFSDFGDPIPWFIMLAFFFARGSSRSDSGTKSLTSSSLARIWLSTRLSKRLGGQIGPRQRLCLDWCRWLLGWFVMGFGGMGVGFWFVGVGFGLWWCSGGVGLWLWLGIDQSKISFCLQTKTKQETHPKP